MQALVEQLEKDGPLAVNLAVEDLEEAEGATTIELSVLLCSDPYIQQLNKEWRSKDSVTDVLSFPQPARVTPIVRDSIPRNSGQLALHDRDSA